MGAEGGHVTACETTTFSEIRQSSPLDGRFFSAISCSSRITFNVRICI
jgi:hypothetical protein